MKSSLKIIQANEGHLPGCYELIKELAAYEKAPEEVTLTLGQFINDFRHELFNAYVAVNTSNEIVGMALYYFVYSTWKGRAMYLEDIIVSENYRRMGIGKMLFEALLKTAKEEKVNRFAWQVLAWNEPALEFYKQYEAHFDGEWVNVRISKEHLEKK